MDTGGFRLRVCLSHSHPLPFSLPVDCSFFIMSQIPWGVELDSHGVLSYLFSVAQMTSHPSCFFVLLSSFLPTKKFNLQSLFALVLSS